ncbi:MAG: insulinase family protein [Acidobacteriia bacterium]|nr:insulinase family protein [Terriglobia bacterium]
MKRLAFALALALPLTAQVKLPPYTREVLPNGVVTYYMQRTGLPLVSFRVLVKGGVESDHPMVAGISSVTAELLRRGTAQHTAEQFNEELDGLGGTFGAGAGDDSTSISAEFLKKDFDRGLALVAEAVLHPSFPEDEIHKAVARRVDGVKSAKDNPGAAINPFYRSFFFGAAHPYGHPADEASYDRIRKEDLVDYHEQMYVGHNLIVIVAGDFDPVAAKARVAATFGAARAGNAYAWAAEQPVFDKGPRVLLVDKPDATQTYFIIAQPGVRRTTPDRVPLNLLNTLFGGRFTSMLNDELRVNSGLTYGAGSSVQMSRLTGAIFISTYTKTETTAKAIDLALDVLKRFHDKGITAEQLASAKAYVKGTLPPRTIQTADQIANVLGEMELYGLGRDEVDQFFARVDAVTLEQANAAVRRYYGTDNLTFVLLGNAAKIRDVAAKYGPKVMERPARTPGWTAM